MEQTLCQPANKWENNEISNDEPTEKRLGDPKLKTMMKRGGTLRVINKSEITEKKAQRQLQKRKSQTAKQALAGVVEISWLMGL